MKTTHQKFHRPRQRVGVGAHFLTRLTSVATFCVTVDVSFEMPLTATFRMAINGHLLFTADQNPRPRARVFCVAKYFLQDVTNECTLSGRFFVCTDRVVCLTRILRQLSLFLLVKQFNLTCKKHKALGMFSTRSRSVIWTTSWSVQPRALPVPPNLNFLVTFYRWELFVYVKRCDCWDRSRRLWLCETF